MTKSSPDSATDLRATEDQPPSTPRWVKVFGIIGVVLVLLLGIIKLAGGDHGPGRHLTSGSASANSEALPASGAERHMQQLGI